MECKRCSFPRLPIVLHLERVHSPLRGRSLLAGEGGGEGGTGAGRSRHEQRHVRQRPRLHRGKKGTLHSTVMTVQGCSPGPQLPRTPIVAQCAAGSGNTPVGNSLRGKFPPWDQLCGEVKIWSDSDSLFFRLAR